MALAGLVGFVAIPAAAATVIGRPAPTFRVGYGAVAPVAHAYIHGGGSPVEISPRVQLPFKAGNPAALASARAARATSKAPARVVSVAGGAQGQTPRSMLGGKWAGSSAGPYIGISHDFQINTGSAPDIEPPDTTMAVGPSFLTEVVNQTIAVYTKAGTLVSFESLNSFYGVSPTTFAMIDPRIVYDPTTNRWFTSSLGVDPSGNSSSMVRVAVSTDSSPAHFFVYQFYASSTATCDRPTLGYSTDKVTFSCNEFTSSGFSQTQTYFINKSEMEAGGTAHFNSFADGGTHFSIVPTVTLDPNGNISATQYLVYNGSDPTLFPRAPVSPVVGVLAALGTPHGRAGDVNLFEVDLALASTAPPPAARQPGGFIETGDSRFESAVWQNNSLWLTGNDSCSNFGTQACVRLVKISTTNWNPGISGSPVVAQNFDVLGTPGLAFYYPAVTMNSGGDPNVVFSESSSNTPVSVLEVEIAQCAVGANLWQLFSLASGTGTYQSTSPPHEVGRWGDYSSAASNPADPNKIWTAAEYTAGSGTREWGTAMNELPISTIMDFGRPYTGGHDAVGVAAGASDWYFAEGFTGVNFDEYLTVQNPGAAQTMCVDYVAEGRQVISRSYNLPASSRTTLRVNDEVGPNLNVSMHVHAANPIIAERPMYFLYSGYVANIRGGHDVMGATALRNTFYFAEGYTGPGLDEYLSMMNVDPSLPSSVVVNYLYSDGSSKQVGHQIPPLSRFTVYVNSPSEAGPNQSVSMFVQVVSGPNIVAERPMYFNYQGKWTGGHVVVGTGAPSTDLDLAEGYVSSTFDEWLTILNPNHATANLTITYNLSGGGPVVKTMTVGANSRGTRLVNADFSAATSQSVHIHSDQPIVVERPMYFDYFGNVQNVTGGHDAVAVDSSTLGTSYSFAEGYVAFNFDEYLTIENNNSSPVTITITYFLSGGGTKTVSGISIPANNRYTRLVNPDLPSGTSASVQVSASGGRC